KSTPEIKKALESHGFSPAIIERIIPRGLSQVAERKWLKSDSTSKRHVLDREVLLPELPIPTLADGGGKSPARVDGNVAVSGGVEMPERKSEGDSQHLEEDAEPPTRSPE